MNEHHSEKKNTHTPLVPKDLDIIDLDNPETFIPNDVKSEKTASKSDKTVSPADIEDEWDDEPSFFDKYLSRINLHVILIIVAVFSVVFIFFRFSSWGIRIKSDFDPDNLGEYEPEVLDNILPLLTDAEAADDGVRTVLALGNAPFADGKGSDSNVASLIEELSDDAKVINCAVADSYLATDRAAFSAADAPMDAFSLYWLSTLMTLNNTSIYEEALASMGSQAPADAVEAYNTLKSLDYSTVDVITIMYDAADYLDGRKLINHDDHNDIQTFYGNLNASLDLLQEAFPHTRFIVMSPTFAYAIDADGAYISGDLHIYEEYALSYYAVMEEDSANSRAISFVDNFYGTVNELNAEEYLTDNVHLNDAGRRRLAERFVYALEYYDEE